MQSTAMQHGRTAQLTEAEVLELSGESCLEDVKELNLRGQGLDGLGGMAIRLPCLLAVSLSHSRVRSLDGFGALGSLTTLNVNSNLLTSLDGIQACAALQQLYAAGNQAGRSRGGQHARHAHTAWIMHGTHAPTG
jgi:hypothetical protein